MLKENINYKFKSLNPFAAMISLAVFPFLIFFLYKFTINISSDFRYLFFFGQFSFVFFFAFLVEIYFNEANRLLVVIPGDENTLLFLRVLGKTLIFIIIFLSVDIIVLLRSEKPFAAVFMLLLLVVSAYAAAYAAAFFINNLIFIVSCFFLLPLILKNFSNITAGIPPLLIVVFLMFPLVFLKFLKFRKKLLQTGIFFNRYYSKIANFIFRLSRFVSNLLPTSSGLRVLFAKDLYYMFANVITLTTILLNLLLFVLLSPLRPGHGFPVNKVVLFAYLFNSAFYSEKLLAIFSGIEKSGVILLKVFPVNIKKIFHLKLLVNTVLILLTGCVNLFFFLYLFGYLEFLSTLLLKYCVLLIINGYFFTLISYFMYKVSTYKPGFDNFSFNAMLYEQAPVHGKEFFGLLPALLLMALSSGFIYYYLAL